MAIVEDISDEEPIRRRRPTRKSKSTSQLTNGGKVDIPLAHPSTVRSSTSKPLINLHSAPSDNEDEDEDEEIEMDEEEFNEYLQQKATQVMQDTYHPEEVEDDEIFHTLIYAVPFTFLYLLLDILVHLQYAHRPTLSLLATHVATALPTLSMIVLYSNRHPTHWLTTSILMAASIVSGSRLIWLVNKASWSVVTSQAPAVGTLWIVSIVQLPLSRALIALFVVGAWCTRSGLAYMPK